jgi:hypothetical protein
LEGAHIHFVKATQGAAADKRRPSREHVQQQQQQQQQPSQQQPDSKAGSAADRSGRSGSGSSALVASANRSQWPALSPAQQQQEQQEDPLAGWPGSVVLEPPLPPEFVVERRPKFAEMLLTNGDVRDLGLVLLTQEERMDLLVRVPWAQMGACLEHPDAEDLLNVLLDHLTQQQEQQQQQGRGQQQQEAGQQQQQQRESDGAASVLPKDLLPQYAEQLERFAPDFMPPSWRSLATWRQVMAGLRGQKVAFRRQAWKRLRKQLVQQQLAAAAAG